MGAVVLALVLAFGTAVMVVFALNPDDTPRCDEPEALTATECFDISATQETVSTILAWPSAVLGGLGVLLALALAVTGRRGRLLVAVAAGAVALGLIAFLVNQF